MLHGLVYSFLSIWDFKNKWEMLNVSFHPSEIGNQLDLLYIHFKRGARHELTQVAHKRQVSSILPDALVRERLAEQNRARDHDYKRALRDRLCVCISERAL